LFLPIVEHINFKQPIYWLFGIIAIGILSIIGIQAVTFNISYDEAYTYLSYSRYNQFFDMFASNLANNHFLNSFLIYFTSLIAPYSSWGLRLPVFIFAVFYFILSASIATKFKNSLLCFGLLTCYYFFIDHFAVARGYGMAATLTLLGFSFLMLEKDKSKNNYTAIVILIIACLANFSALSILVSVLGYLWIFEYKKKLNVFSKKQNIILIGSICVIVVAFLNVTKEGRPLFGAYNGSFTTAVTNCYLQNLFPFVQFPVSVAYVIEFVFLFYFIFAIIKFPHKAKFGIILGFNFIIIYLSSHLLHKPYPTDRVLIPYWCLIVMAILEFTEHLSAKLSLSKLVIMSFNSACLILLFFSFGKSVTLEKNIFNDSEIISFEKDMLYEVNISSYDFNKNTMRPDIEFYARKGKFYNTIPENISKLKPDTIIKTENEVLRFYKQKKIVSIYMNKEKKANSYTYDVNFNNDSSFVSQKINTDLFEYELKDSICRLILFPKEIKLLKQVVVFNNQNLIAKIEQ